MLALICPVPGDHQGQSVAREMAATYRQFGQVIGHQYMREAFIGNRIRGDRVIAAFDEERLLGYLAIRLDRIGPFTFTVRDFRRQFGRVNGTLRHAALRFLERRERRDEIFIDGFLVSPHARGGGIGVKLLERGEEIGRQAGKRVFRVRVRADNPKAAAFYRRQGFRDEGASEITWLARLAGIGPVNTFAKEL